VTALTSGETAQAMVSTIALVEIDTSGVIRAVNGPYCRLVGRSPAELVGHHVREFTHADDRHATAALLERIGDGERRELVIEKRCLRPDGATVWLRISAIRGHADRLIGHVTDITDVVAARSAAEGAARRCQALIANSADIIAVIDAEGRLIDANPAGERLLGHPLADKRGATLLDLIHPDDLAAVTAALAAAAVTPGLQPEITCRIQTAEGGWKHVRAIGNSQLDDPAIGGIVVNAHDISETVGNLRSLVGALVRATEYRDPYTAGHQVEVARLSQQIATRLGLPQDEVSRIELGASLHDVGKIAVPSEILTRPGRLTPPEWEIVKSHTTAGYEILTDVDFAAPITDIVRHHHERLDGSGYPDGLSGDDIKIGARIVAVADVVDAISSHRPYRPARGIEAAHDEIRSNRGKTYDAEVVDAALSQGA
jgi:PAS domain S-box-containing protein/putative nucleotidyltransferase with HDIG domain